MSLAVIIPAVCDNKYSTKGDLVSFGDTSLLEWKIAQCKEIVSVDNIYISSDCQLIREIADRECVNFIQRKKFTNYTDMILEAVSHTSESNILWANPTAPFVGKDEYSNMLLKYYNEPKYDSVVSVYEKQDFVFFGGRKLNFSNEMVPRVQLEPIYILSNGCYVISKDNVLKYRSLFGDNPYLFKLEYLPSTEIKSITSLEMSAELISDYFKRDLHVNK
jgi:CMP-N-acetylneuraminic acid synthetase